MRSRRAWLLLLPVIAFLVGCGGGEDSIESQPTTATTTALTKAQLVEQGDAICAEVNAAVGTVGASSAETSTPGAQAAGLYGGMIASLKNLGTPQEAEGYPEFVAAAEALATAEDEVELAAEREDPGLASAESKASSALSSFQAAAGEYGFEDCSEGPKPPSGGVTPESEAGGAEAPGSEPEAAEETPEAVEETPEAAPETGGAGGGTEGGGTTGGSAGGGGSGGIGPG